MKGSVLTTTLIIIPGLLAAQQSASASASASATAQANVSAPASYSADSRAKIDAAFEAARASKLPEQPMRQRIAEGKAKGASEAQVVAAVQHTQTRLAATQSAMIRAGRTSPQPEEVTSGEQAMERGATGAQIEALVKRAPSDRSLAVAFDVLAKLEARGQPVDQAIAQIGAKLDGKATDASITALVGGVNGAVNAAVGASAGAKGQGGAASVGGVVTGVAGAVGPKKP